MLLADRATVGGRVRACMPSRVIVRREIGPSVTRIVARHRRRLHHLFASACRRDHEPRSVTRQRASHPVEQTRQIHRPGSTRNFPAVDQQHQRRDAADREAAGQRLRLLGIDLHGLHHATQFARGGFEHGRHRPAWTTPFGPEVHQQGQTAALRIVAESLLVQRQRPAVEQRGAAAPALALAETCDRHTIDRITGTAQHVARIHQGNLPALIQGILKHSNLDPENLKLELTETFLIHETEETIQTLREIKAMGVHLYIDDFGAGYASLRYLKSFPVDGLKLDQSLIQQLPHSSNDAAIVKAVISLAKALGLQVIAEGVETQEQMDFLEEHGCDAMQGYWLAPPLPAHESAQHMVHI